MNKELKITHKHEFRWRCSHLFFKHSLNILSTLRFIVHFLRRDKVKQPATSGHRRRCHEEVGDTSLPLPSESVRYRGSPRLTAFRRPTHMMRLTSPLYTQTSTTAGCFCSVKRGLSGALVRLALEDLGISFSFHLKKE